LRHDVPVREATLELLCCPICAASESRLLLTDRYVPVLRVDRDEVEEGSLECSKCDALFPILLGVALLVPDYRAYLCERWPEIAQILTMNRAGLSIALQDKLDAEPAIALSTGRIAASWEGLLGTGMYAQAHFGNDGVAASLERAGVTVSPDVNFFDRVAASIYNTSANTLAIDVGCNVGGMSSRLARSFARVVGIDLSFSAIYYGRRIPGIDGHAGGAHFRRQCDGLKIANEMSATVAASNYDMIVAAAEHLPFAQSCAGLVTALNVLELVPSPRTLLNECVRVLAESGCLALASPYYWRSDRSPLNEWLVDADGSQHCVELELTSRQMRIDDVTDLPWIVSPNDRCVQIWISSLTIATKS
jgi:SAM-dependent methyltransferase/uncharacterized protein YbaR (Trm112 family)